jgi:hypothetical protein
MTSGIEIALGKPRLLFEFRLPVLSVESILTLLAASTGLRVSEYLVCNVAMGELWELVIPFSVEILRPAPIVSSYKELTIALRTWDGADLVRGRNYGGTLFSQRAQDWFTERWGQFVTFDPFSAV